MTKVFAIARKEFTSYFRSPIAYIFMFVTISLFHVFFFLIIEESREASLRDVFQVMEFMFIFFIPLLTMKTFSEEKFTGTMEFLMTTPTSNTAIVLGKYLGSLLFFSLIILFTGVYYLIIELYGDMDRGAILVGYLGIWLEGAFFVAIGLMTSSLSRNQIIAAICSYVILFLLYFAMSFAKYLTGVSAQILEYMSTLNHVQNFTAGLVHTSDLTYYLSGIAFSLLITRYFIENRLWR